MFTVHIVVSVLNCGLLVTIVVVFVLCGHFLLHKLKLVGIKGTVANNVTKNFDGLANISLKDLHAKIANLSFGLALESCSHSFDGLAELTL